ncbi:DUF732 domain-containing protein [Solwaraspora sp. WMMD1047]|uniref:DUF732 domain-containing protein n=1 Tax=Solwaraspora sp. WMMD1047 TaxID=3016102 RepID=UPI00241672DD|nr:DUF732 domain-containing protein [Solwaraspora sp. WMMD1047]MDG4832433.1 DUF732 domain-containing protein [Solwaraspora sp. WMMD1047]
MSTQPALPRKVMGALGVLMLLVICVIGGLIVFLPNASDDEPASVATEAAAERAYLDALAELDPALVSSEQVALNAGENICQEVETGKEPDIAAKNAAARFEVDESRGAELVAVAREHLCP